MPWLQLRLDCEKTTASVFEDVLLEAGALSVTLEDREDQPLLEPAVGSTPLWDAIRLTGLFPADQDMQAAISTLQSMNGASEPRLELLEDKDWEREWMQHYRPMRFGERLWICPSWQDPPDKDAVNLLLDPGLAFGTGTHPTTALCLQALAGMELRGKRVVDFGCGSGILGIAALKLGADSLLAIDNDPQALSATADNAQRNGIAPHRFETRLPEDYEANAWRQSADLVLANILAGPLAALSDELYGLLAPTGRLILAGLLESQMGDLVQRYAPKISLTELDRQGEWICLGGSTPD